MTDALELTYATGLTVEPGVPLGPHTSLKIGGPADFFARARDARELSRCLGAAHSLGVPWLLLGGGSNMLISDHGFRGLAIKVEAPPGQRNRGEVLQETGQTVRLRCQAGAFSAGLARWTAGLGWHDLEWASRHPRHHRGAAAGNAGAYDGDMARSVERVRAWFPEGERTLEGAEMEFQYRASRFKQRPPRCAPRSATAPSGVILAVELRLTPGTPGAALARIEAYERQRREKQPTERSCGSVFKNPPSDHAGRLIDVAGLKGTTVGGAQISLKHGNFFVNRGQARAADVVSLIRLARRRVEEESGVRLETEILFAGDWAPEDLP